MMLELATYRLYRSPNYHHPGHRYELRAPHQSTIRLLYSPDAHELYVTARLFVTEPRRAELLKKAEILANALLAAGLYES